VSGQNSPPPPELATGAPARAPTPDDVHQLLAHLLGVLALDLLPLGLAVGDVERMLLQHYVNGAAEALGGREGAASTASIAIATGLSRHRVNQLLRRPTEGTKTRRTNRALRVAEGWLADRAYHADPSAKVPPPVPYAGAHSFCALVRRYSGDMPPAAMRKFMLEGGMLQARGTGPSQQLWLQPRPQDAEALQSLAGKLQAVIAILET
jgi:hypothetical protein